MRMPLSGYFRLPLLGLPIALLTGCPTLEQPRHISYQCSNDYNLRVDLYQNRAIIHLQDKQLLLPRLSNMKGERYLSEDKRYLFYRKGNNAVLATEKEHGMLICHEYQIPINSAETTGPRHPTTQVIENRTSGIR